MDIKAIQALLFELIGIDSTSYKSNEPIISCIESHLDGANITTYRLPSSEKGKYNLLVMKGNPRDDGLGLTLCGHVDTVPASADKWQSDPWQLVERGEHWFARGACDMKGFVAIAIAALLDAQVPSAPLALLFTCDEELGSYGAKHLVTQGLPVPIPSQVIIGEPTSLQVVRLHKGHLSMHVTIEGVAAHTGSPHLGKNAAVAGGEVIASLAKLSATMESERTNESEYFASGAEFPVLTVATVQSGSAINVVPDTCTVGLGLRLLPSQNQDETIQRVKQAISDACTLPWELKILGDNPTMLTRESSKINRWLCDQIGQHGSVGVSFGTDGGYLARADFDCVLYGAGDIAVAHKPDEFVPINEIEKCATTIDQAIVHFCGGSA